MRSARDSSGRRVLLRISNHSTDRTVKCRPIQPKFEANPPESATESQPSVLPALQRKESQMQQADSVFNLDRAGEAEVSTTTVAHNAQSQRGRSPGRNSLVVNTPIGSSSTDSHQANSSLLGDNSLLSIAERWSSATPEDPNRTIAFQSGILPLLGDSVREEAPVALVDTRAALYRSLPDDQLIVELFEVYRIRVHPLNGITMAIVWQDSLLSLAFDRSPGSYDMDCKDDLVDMAVAAGSGGLGYRPAMNWLCHIALQYLLRRSTAGSSCDIASLFQDMHLVQEHSAFTLHKNFVIATFCRPFISGSNLPSSASANDADVLGRFQDALRCSAKAYVRLRSIAGYSSRSWAFIHNGLSSVLLLSLMKETRNATDTRKLQTDLIESLSKADTEFNSSAGAALTAHHLSPGHKRALSALQKLKRLADQDRHPEVNCDALTGRPAEINPFPGNATGSALADDCNQLEFWNEENWFQSFNDDVAPLDAFDSFMLDQYPAPTDFSN
ncbi:hypothetical protein AK830_g9019 [Neonectria ditissima]|uniref:Transcription factor domain-containing protein n=1 Tax=Neonectria ditissima TaxID=78410 RepID=A0A0P7AJ80_9HYPO|nr:hypothetical protein AK830_g9019 [Neonectria ditissima]